MLPTAPANRSARRALRTLVALVAVAGALIAPTSASAWEKLDDFPLPSAADHIDTSITELNATDVLNARVLLPDGYSADPGKRWPVLYMLNGAGENWTGWTDPEKGNAQTTLAGLSSRAIIVMPEGGRGFYSDWWLDGTRTGANWERYLLEEVIPYMEANYRILPGRQNHAIGGLSMGGYGAPALAAQLPTYFGNVLILSGLLDNQSSDTQFGFSQRSESADYNEIWGSPNSIYAAVHNTMYLVENMRGSRVYLYSGNGIANISYGFLLDQWTLGGYIESVVKKQSTAWEARAKATGSAVTTSYRSGVHSWPYWRAELPRYVNYGPFGAPPITETSQAQNWTYYTMAPHGNAWGVGFKFATAPTGLVTIRRQGRLLQFDGSGTVTVTLGAADDDATGAGTGCTGTATMPFTVELPEGC